MILVVSHTNDSHAVQVLEGLNARGQRALLLDTARFPREVQLDVGHDTGGASVARVHLDGRTVDLTETRVVWWRRPNPFVLHDELAQGEAQEFAWAECHAALMGLWPCLDAHWVNDPQNDEKASRKAWQLKVAAELGLRIPKTLVTSCPEQARAFVEEQGCRGTIYKAFQATETAWRETRLLRPGEHELLSAVRYAPVIFQEYVAARSDLRVTVVGDRIFAVEVRSSSADYEFDYRMNLARAEVSAHQLPVALEDKVRELMARFGLVYGALDFRLTDSGEYVFLEINPAGQWQFLSDRVGAPVTAAMVDYLSAQNRA